MCQYAGYIHVYSEPYLNDSFDGNEIIFKMTESYLVNMHILQALNISILAQNPKTPEPLNIY